MTRSSGKGLELGLEHHRAGRLEEARRAYGEILESEPDNPDALHFLGLLEHQSGDHGEAERLISRAIAGDPERTTFHANHGSVLGSLGRTEAAVAAFRRAVELDPANAAAQLNLVQALRAANRNADVEAVLRAAVAALPGDPALRLELGNTLYGLGRAEEALAAYSAAVDLDPGLAGARHNRGTVLLALGRAGPAAEAFARAAELEPDFADAHNSLGNALSELERPDEAEAAYRRALAADPGHAAGHKNLAALLAAQGQATEARAVLENAIGAVAADARAGLRVQLATVLPVIPGSADDIDRARAAMTSAIGALKSEGLALADPLGEVGQANFYLAYHGRDDRPLQEQLAAFHAAACPALTWTAPHCAGGAANTAKDKERPIKIGPIKIGLVSPFFYSHPVGRLTEGLVRELSRDRFEVTVVHAGRRRDQVSEAMEGAADRTVELPGQLEAARRMLADCAFDVLFYPDLGMAALTYYLAFARLAPVQCTSWGHPVTTGIANVDYFLSARALEPEDGEAHYSERLVRLGRMPTCLPRPRLPEPVATRRELGLPEEATLYACPQTLFKFHPDFDAILTNILRRDPGGRLVLIEGKHGRWAELLRERLARLDADAAERIIFLPHQPVAGFLSLLHQADVILDPICFGGGVTSYEAFAIGAPVVTLPGRFMRGRVTAGLYDCMGIGEAVAESTEDYVELALGLAADAGRRQRLGAAIAERSHVLYDDLEAVREIEAFFEAALAAARTGGPLIDWNQPA